MVQVVCGKAHVFLGHSSQTGPFLPRQRAGHFGRRAQYQGAGRNASAGGDQGACADERLLADHCAVKDDRTHANQYLVANRAGVNDGTMTNGNIMAHDTEAVVRQVQDGVVLDVRVVADDDAIEVTTEHGVAPDAGVMPERHVAQHHHTPGDINAFAKGWFLEQEPVELPFH